MDFLLPSLGILTLLTIFSVVIKEKSEFLKYILFGAMTLIIVAYTGNLIWSTVSVNMASVTKGPVHYHADFQIWNCGEMVDLIDPKGWDNKIGTPLLHEHNDGRIHVEGPVLDYQEISLGNFFKVVGGELIGNSLMVPTNNGPVKMESGGVCDNQPGQLQVFVYKTSLRSDDLETEGNTFTQQKLVDPQSFVLSPHSQIPPGDCIIIEFNTLKEKTDKICNFYKVKIDKGELNEL